MDTQLWGRFTLSYMSSFSLQPGPYVIFKFNGRKRNEVLHSDQSFNPVNCYKGILYLQSTWKWQTALKLRSFKEKIDFHWRVSLSFFIPYIVRSIRSNMPRVALGGHCLLLTVANRGMFWTSPWVRCSHTFKMLWVGSGEKNGADSSLLKICSKAD